MENSDGCSNLLLQNSLIRLITRILPLFLALWHHVDIVLDVKQSIKYYQMAYGVDGPYQNWALQLQKTSNSTYLQTLSPYYFYVGMVVWILPSFLCAITFCIYNFGGSKDKFPGRYIMCCFNEKTSTYGPCLCSIILITIFVLPTGTVICLLVFYLVVPLALLWNAIHALIVGVNFDEEKTYGCLFPKKSLTFLKLLEVAGEALPQLILNITFILKNYPYLLENDIYFSVPVPISVISAVFSIGSLLIAITDGLKAMNS